MIVSREGYVLTNNHVIANADDIQVLLYDGRVAKAKVVGADVELGEGCVVHHHAVIQGPSKFGARNIFHPFSVVGGDPQDYTFGGERVELIAGDGNIFREQVTVSRGTVKGGGVTRLGNDNFFLSYSHVGHDSQVGNGTLFVNGATIAGHVDADMFWERITYFLDRVIPVANEYKIRMACHPQDPGVPPEGYQGVNRVLGTVDGLKKFITIQESEYHGLNFCQGTVSEMLTDPGTQIYDVIRYFGTRKKIFNVHFRNIRGHRNDFVEVYPDEGDVDMVKAIRVYREVGYPYMLMPDHVPLVKNDPNGLQSFAFCYGYIRGLIQSLDSA